MKKHYSVEMTTTQKTAGSEDFWMYRDFGTREDAMAAARSLGGFFPYQAFPTVVEVFVYDLVGNELRNKKKIRSYHLKDEDGKTVK